MKLQVIKRTPIPDKEVELIIFYRESYMKFKIDNDATVEEIEKYAEMLFNSPYSTVLGVFVNENGDPI